MTLKHSKFSGRHFMAICKSEMFDALNFLACANNLKASQ